jgi:hypothetical protein
MYIQFYKKGKVLSNKSPYEQIGETFIPADATTGNKKTLADTIKVGIEKAKSLGFPAFKVIGTDFSTTLIEVAYYGLIDLREYFESLESNDKRTLLDYKTYGNIIKDMYPEKWMNIRNDIVKKYGRNSPQYRGFEVNFNPDRYCNIEVPF